MSCYAPPLGREFRGRGPAQRRLLEWLRPRVDCPLDAAVAQRSPAGPWVVKLHAPNHVATCVDLLQAEPWVERVVARPQHLYVRVTTKRLCAWVVEGFAADRRPVATDEGAGRSVLVRGVDVDALREIAAPRPLRLFRETVIARSVAALLASRGYDVKLELLPPGGEAPTDAHGECMYTVVVGEEIAQLTEADRGEDVVRLPVGEVDVRHGPLRARNGGSVSADDVVAEIGRAAPGGEQEARAYGEAVLALLLVATPRTRRIDLDDGAVRRETMTFAGLVDVLRLSAGRDVTHAAGRRPEGGEAVRNLAAELDLIATNVGRGTTALDPALVARSLRSIADRVECLCRAGATPSGDPLWSATRQATSSALALAGIDVGEARLLDLRCAASGSPAA